MDFSMILEWAIKALFLILFLTTGFAYTTWLERKVLARIQARIGPNRAGPYALLQPVADGIKLIFKEDVTPANAHKVIYYLAPIMTVVPALIITAVVPWGREIVLFGRTISLYIADINIGVLYIMAVTSISVYGITLAGWSSNNKYATLGGVRSTAQMISYELALGFALIGPILLAGSMSLKDIVETQKGLWFIVSQPVAFVVYFLASLAEVNRAPFDMPEAEQELTAGYHAEYSSMKFALFFMAEYIKVLAISMIGSTIFLGGFQGPWVDQYPWLGPVYLLVKSIVWLFVVVWVRGTLPRVRYDRLMALGWKVLFPVALLSVMVTALVVLVMGV